MKIILVFLGALSLLALGCEQKSEAPAAGGAAKTSAAVAAQPAPAGSAQTAQAADEPATEEEFEEEAAKEISNDNLEAELDKMDKEIGQ